MTSGGVHHITGGTGKTPGIIGLFLQPSIFTSQSEIPACQVQRRIWLYGSRDDRTHWVSFVFESYRCFFGMGIGASVIQF